MLKFYAMMITDIFLYDKFYYKINDCNIRNETIHWLYALYYVYTIRWQYTLVPKTNFSYFREKKKISSSTTICNPPRAFP